MVLDEAPKSGQKRPSAVLHPANNSRRGYGGKYPLTITP
jgi:hypothetical protein